MRREDGGRHHEASSGTAIALALPQRVDAAHGRFRAELSQTRRATVVALIVDQRERDRLAPVLRAFGDVRFCDRPAELWEAIASANVIAFVTNPLDRDRRPIATTVDELRRLMPSLPIIVHTSGRNPAHLREVATLRHTSGLVVVDDRSDARLRATAAESMAETPAQDATAGLLLTVETIHPPLDPLVCTYIRTVVRRLRWPLSVRTVMDAIGSTKRRTLDDRLRAATLPTAEQLIGWVFVLQAAWLLTLPNATFKGVAQRLGFANPGTLRSMFRHRAGLSVRDVIRRGGFQYLLRRFLAVLHGDWSREPQQAARARRPRALA